MASNMMNPMQLIQMIKGNSNPSQFVMNMLEQQAGNNPLFSNILNLAKNGKGGDIEQIARNMFKEQGRDFDKEFTDFKQMFGL